MALAAVAAVGPDSLELGGGLIEAAERTAGDGLVVQQPDEQAAAGRGELVGRIPAQPFRDGMSGSAVAARVFDGKLGEERLGQWVVLADRHETESVDCG